jgi:hypothetical protein
VNGATLAVMAKRSYRLTVQGELSDNLQPAFPGMELARSDGNTALAGTVRDQAELQGLLRRGAMPAITAVLRGAGRVGEDVPAPGSRPVGMVGALIATEDGDGDGDGDRNSEVGDC